MIVMNNINYLIKTIVFDLNTAFNLQNFK